jgi:hypothetical protein
MGQKLVLLEQLAAAQERAEGAETRIEIQLNTFVSGMVVGGAMTRAEDVIRTAKLALQSHRADIKRILDDLDRV